MADGGQFPVKGAFIGRSASLSFPVEASPASTGVKKSAIVSTRWVQGEHWFCVYPVAQTCWYWEVLG